MKEHFPPRLDTICAASKFFLEWKNACDIYQINRLLLKTLCFSFLGVWQSTHSSQCTSEEGHCFSQSGSLQRVVPFVTCYILGFLRGKEITDCQAASEIL